MDVNVDVQNAIVAFEQLEDAEDDIVYVAEARRLALLGVVQPARPVDGDIRLLAVELRGAS